MFIEAMVTAVLSFVDVASSGRVTFRCEALDIHERRDINDNPPFVAWSRAYATGRWDAQVLRGIGLAIGNWFDGAQNWLDRLLRSPGPVILTIETSKEPEGIETSVLDAPWELMARMKPAPPISPPGLATAQGSYPEPVAQLLAQLGAVDLERVHHLALDPDTMLTPVRRVGAMGEVTPPSQYRMSVVSMAAQPDGATSLEVDREADIIRRATGGIGVDLVVEDSGTLQGLGELVARAAECDVIHVTSHAAHGNQPVLALEGEQGERVDVTADDINLGIGTKPRLLILSMCSPSLLAPAALAETQSGVLGPLSRDLCRRGFPAVLGWSCTSGNRSDTALATTLYQQLSRRATLEEALGKARVALAGTPGATAWHAARLYLAPSGGGKLVDSTKTSPGRPSLLRDRAFLDSNQKIRIALDRPVDRGALRRVMAVLRDGTSAAIVVHGSDELSRATFAGRVLQRVERELPRVVIARDFDAPAILQEIVTQTANGQVVDIVNRYRQGLNGDRLLQALREIIAGPCKLRNEGAFALVLHGFEPLPRVDGQGDTPSRLPADRLLVARALLLAFRGAVSDSRLLFTSTVPFSVPDSKGDDIADLLLFEALDVTSLEPTVPGIEEASQSNEGLPPSPNAHSSSPSTPTRGLIDFTAERGRHGRFFGRGDGGDDRGPSGAGGGKGGGGAGGHGSGVDGRVDIGILTIRDDEFRAVLDAFPQKAGVGVHKGASRQYILRHADVATGERYTVAILRQVEQGTGEAQHVARDLIDDLAPKLVLVVGIAGGLPSDDVTLGDVVLGTRIHDYTVEAVKVGHEVTYAATGGPINQAIAAAVVALAGREDELGDWTSELPSQPTVAWTGEGQVYGPPEWQRELRSKLEHHYGAGASRRAPTYVSGPIASSDRLVKDPAVLFPWLTTARNLLAVEMESGGVYRAARERCPMLAIRGISDIVGLKRADAWTKYACASAAAFARAFLRTQPVPVGATLGAADPR